MRGCNYMKNQNGVSLPILIIAIALILIVAAMIGKYGVRMLKDTKLKDLRTDMLLIQADTKKNLEEVRFQTVNLDKNKEEDLEKIDQIKKENLKGTLVKGSDIEKNIPSEITIDDNCYYIEENELKQMGVKNFETEKYGNYIVKYNFDDITVEVINSKGYEGQYTLTQLLDD